MKFGCSPPGNWPQNGWLGNTVEETTTVCRLCRKEGYFSLSPGH